MPGLSAIIADIETVAVIGRSSALLNPKEFPTLCSVVLLIGISSEKF